ncbi:hypothetical protein M407DRAFT_241175, partial [Tulasnella calospora MUT 4182]
MVEIIGIQKGIEMVAEFIRATGTFAKSGWETWPRTLKAIPAITVGALPSKACPPSPLIAPLCKRITYYSIDLR